MVNAILKLQKNERGNTSFQKEQEAEAPSNWGCTRNLFLGETGCFYRLSLCFYILPGCVFLSFLCLFPSKKSFLNRSLPKLYCHGNWSLLKLHATACHTYTVSFNLSPDLYTCSICMTPNVLLYTCIVTNRF